MRYPFILILGIALFLCNTSVFSQNIKDRELIGLTVAEVIQRLNLSFDKNFVIEEPPGVPRGVRAKTQYGETIEVYIQRGDVPFNEKRNWELSDFENIKAIEIIKLNN